jgi:hypothetical protein
MNTALYDVIVVGAGIAGLYMSYMIKKKYPEMSVLILEKNPKKYLGGRAQNVMFYGESIAEGAGIGRLKKDILLMNLMIELNIPIHTYTSRKKYAFKSPENVSEVIRFLKQQTNSKQRQTFKSFAKRILGKSRYENFLLSVGYTDFEEQDAHDVLYNYGMDDNGKKLEAFSVPWTELVYALSCFVDISYNSGVQSIEKENSHYYHIQTERHTYYSKKVILATTIHSIQNLLKMSIYDDIVGQPFLRIYGKFDSNSTEILKKYVQGYTVVSGYLQKIIPIQKEKGIYMICYNDNKYSIALKNRTKNTSENRRYFCKLMRKALGISEHLKLLNMKSFYWEIGTHYYKPLKSVYKNRSEFISKAQHPQKNMYVIGEVVSKHQGWVEGALESCVKILKYV